MIGYKYGVLRWSKTGSEFSFLLSSVFCPSTLCSHLYALVFSEILEKTIEGTAAGITSVLAACSILVSLLASSGYILSQVRPHSCF
jgi:dolichol kinase